MKFVFIINEVLNDSLYLTKTGFLCIRVVCFITASSKKSQYIRSPSQQITNTHLNINQSENTLEHVERNFVVRLQIIHNIILNSNIGALFYFCNYEKTARCFIYNSVKKWKLIIFLIVVTHKNSRGTCFLFFIKLLPKTYLRFQNVTP